MFPITEAGLALTRAVSSIFHWIDGIVSDLVAICKIVYEALGSVPSYFQWIPENALYILGIIFVIVAAYKIFGREG